MEHTSNEKIADALKLLEDAAKQKKDELKTVISDKYTNFRSLIMENEKSLMNSLSTAKTHAVDAANHAKDVGVEKAREMARDVDQSVRRKPWPYIGGSLVFGVLLGFILGRKSK